MAEEKRVVMLDDFEQRLMVNGLTDFRNDLLREDKPTEDVDDLILKVIDAPSSSRTAHRLFPRKREKCAHSVAPPLPAKSTDSAGTPNKEKRRSDRAAR